MTVEAVRGCGYRKVHGLYLCGEGVAMSCDRLPYELKVCPVCGSGIKFSRGFTWLDWYMYAGDHEGCSEKLPTERIETTIGPAWKMPIANSCPVCWPNVHPQPYGLLWVGEAFYTPDEFIAEALTLGVSKRIAAVPKNLKLGETWILFAHKKLIEDSTEDPWTLEEDEEGKPGIFYAFRPTSVDYLIWKSEAVSGYLEELQKKGLTPVVIPDGDVDHDPDTKLKMSDSERNHVADERFAEDIKSRINAL